MSGWLTKASEALSRGAAPEPEPFEIVCLCGQLHRGLRQDHAQRVVCQSCGHACFVLPADAYPQSASKQRKRRSAGKAAKPAANVAARPVHPTDVSIADPPTDSVSSTAAPLYGPRKKLLTPLRLVMLCLVGAVFFTGLWVVHRRGLDEAELTLTAAQESGLAALREGDFIAAARELEIACDALDLLGRDNRAARDIRRLRNEATAAGYLASASLYDIARHAEDMHKSDEDDAWKNYFEAHFRDSWLILDTYVALAPEHDPVEHEAADDADSGRKAETPQVRAPYLIDYPLLIGERPAELELPTPLFEPLAIGKEPRRVIFAAQLEFYRPEGDRWVVGLRPDTAFLWSDLGNYKALGFSDDPHVAQVLEQQRQALEGRNH
jgi:hypothetical protein